MEEPVPVPTRVSKDMQRFGAKERQRQAIQLRQAGATYQQIAEQLGYSSASGAHAAVKKAMDEFPREDVETLREVDNARLNSMLLTLWPLVQKGDFGAMDRALRIMERIAKLNGTDAPLRSETTHIGGGTTNIGTVIIDGTKQEYIEALRKARGELPDPGVVDEVIDVESVEQDV